MIGRPGFGHRRTAARRAAGGPRPRRPSKPPRQPGNETQSPAGHERREGVLPRWPCSIGSALTEDSRLREVLGTRARQINSTLCAGGSPASRNDAPRARCQQRQASRRIPLFMPRTSRMRTAGQLLVQGRAADLTDRRGAVSMDVRPGARCHRELPLSIPVPGPGPPPIRSSYIARQVPDLAIQPSKYGRRSFLPGGQRRPGTERVWISGLASRPDRHPLSPLARVSKLNLLRLSLGVDPGQAGPCSCRPPSGSGWRAYKRQPPLALVAAPGNAARSPRRWRARHRHASRCIRARHPARRSDAAGR